MRPSAPLVLVSLALCGCVEESAPPPPPAYSLLALSDPTPPVITWGWAMDDNPDRVGTYLESAGDVDGDGYDDLLVCDGKYDTHLFFGTPYGLQPTAQWQYTTDDTLPPTPGGGGDVDGDGYHDVAVGEPRWSSGDGRVDVFLGSEDGPSSTPDWTYTGTQSDTRCGPVDLGGDVDGDGYGDLLIGCPGYDRSTVTDAGAILLFLGSSTGLKSPFDWRYAGRESSTGLASDVAFLGDVDGDGDDELGTAASGKDDTFTDEGALLVWYGDPSGPARKADYTLYGGQADAYLGALAAAGDVDGDGYDDVLAGAWGYDTTHLDEGRVVLLHGSASGLGAIAWSYAPADSAAGLGGLGTFASAGDLDGDGYGDVSVGYPPELLVFYGASTGLASAPGDAWSYAEATDLGGAIGDGGDFDGDGYDDAPAGAPTAGQAWVLPGSGTGLTTSGILEVHESPSTEGGLGRLLDHGDVNGDGHDDFLLSTSADVLVLHGDGTGLPDTVAATLLAESGWTRSAITGLDLDDDGYDEVVVADPRGNWIRVHPGSSSGVSSTSYHTLSGTIDHEEFGRVMAPAGDVNGDGYDDLVVGDPEYCRILYREGWVGVYHGSSTGVSSTPDWERELAVPGEDLGSWVASAGDVDGDGYDDVLMGSRSWDDREGIVWLYQGSATGLGSTADWEMAGGESSGQADVAYGLGDVDADGYDDVAVVCVGCDVPTSRRHGRVQLFRGSSSGLSTTPSWTSYSLELNQTITRLAPLGDIDSNGWDDLALASPRDDLMIDQEGSVSIYLGSSTGWGTEPDFKLTYLGSDSFAQSLLGGRDYDEDGDLELVIGTGTDTYYSVEFTDVDEDGEIWPLDWDDRAGLTWWPDADGDGYGDASASGTVAETAPSGSVSNHDDCDDSDDSVFPGAPESCNGVDDDCDGDVDEGASGSSVFYADGDGDGYGDPTTSTTSCLMVSGYIADDTDCDDDDASVYPGAPEHCGGTDHDCDGLVDEPDSVDAPSWYLDIDADGFGNARYTAVACDQPTGFVDDATDCDDLDASSYPGADEVCDGTDNDCDGSSDDEDDDLVLASAPGWYADADADGFGDPDVVTRACVVPGGHLADAGDCDDNDAAVYPGAEEHCDERDEDCDGDVDEGSVDAPTWFSDVDGDGFGGGQYTIQDCSPPAGYVGDTDDCDDLDPDTYPGAVDEPGDDIDQDCDGEDARGCGCSVPAAPSGSLALLGLLGAVVCRRRRARGARAVARSGETAHLRAVHQVPVRPPALLVLVSLALCGCAEQGVSPPLPPFSSLALSDPDPPVITWGWAMEGVYYRTGAYLETAGDVDGDGYDDLLVCDGVSETYLFFGTPYGLQPTIQWQTTSDGGGPPTPGGGGDVDGDGYDDVAVGEPGWGSGEGRVDVLLGSEDGPSSTPDWTYTGTQPDTRCGPVDLGGDVDGDGYGDLLVGCPGYDDSTVTDAGAILLFLGSSTGLGASADWSYVGPESSTGLASDVAFLGDVDGDGDEELGTAAAGMDDTFTDEGALLAWYGDPSGPASSADYTLYGGQTDAHLGALAAAGDVDGDGYDDVLAGAWGYDSTHPDEGRVVLLQGSASGLGSIAWSYAPADSAAGLGGLGTFASAGDLDGDGYGDVSVGHSPELLVFYGASTGLASAPGDTWSHEEATDLGGAVGDGGDFDGDGYDDAPVGAPYDAQAWVFPGSSTGLTTSGILEVHERPTTDALLGNLLDHGDVNGDGHDDFILMTTSDVLVLHGDGTGLPDTVAATLLAEPYWTRSAITGLDLDDDGYDEVVVADPRGNWIRVHPGSPSGVSSTTYDTLYGTAYHDGFGRVMAPAGDVNGDGYDDLVVGDLGYSKDHPSEGWVGVYHGSSTGVSSTPDWEWETDILGETLGSWVASAGDVDGDGYDDVLMGSTYWNGTYDYEGIVWLYEGSATGLGSTADWEMTGGESYGYADVAYGVGDVDTDGYDDVAVVCRRCDSSTDDKAGRVQIFHGSSSGLSTTASWTTYGLAEYQGFTRLSLLGDIDSDGWDDLALASPVDDLMLGDGSVSIYLGSSTGWGTEPDFKLTYLGDPFAQTVLGGRDCDEDGDLELIIGSGPWTYHSVEFTDADEDGEIWPLDWDDRAGLTWWPDADGDGYGDASASGTVAETAPSGSVSNDDDCDDSDDTVYPGAPEACDGVDDDCDGDVDEGASGSTVFYADSDGDGYGDPTTTTTSCIAGSGYTADDTDCDDDDASVYPGAPEHCGGTDHDCDGLADEPDSVDAPTWYVDLDDDGFGSAPYTAVACDRPLGFVDDATDCDDLDASSYPGADEVCDGTDNDCDGSSDDEDDDLVLASAPEWYADEDGDGFGDPEAVTLACVVPAGHLAIAGDCDDTDAAVYPGADEHCDERDEDCDGDVDEGSVDAPTWFSDADGDGFGGGQYTVQDCSPPAGYVDDTDDCDDLDPDVFPGAVDEPGDDVDQDCDGEDARGCGCSAPVAPSGSLALLGLLGAVVRRRR